MTKLIRHDVEFVLPPAESLMPFASTISGHFVHIRVTNKTGNAQHIATPTEETRATGHRGYT